MRNDGYLQLLTTSGKRIGILTQLDQKSRTLTEIKDYFKIKTTAEIVPRLKELKGEGLISFSEDKYHITVLGEICLKHLVPLLNLTEALDSSTFWKNHDLSYIPYELLYKINELKNCKVVRIEEYDHFESNKPFINACLNATSFRGGAHVFFKEWITLFPMLAERKIPIEIITTPQIYNKLKDVYPTELELFLRKGAKLYVSEDFKVTFSIISDDFFQMSLNTHSGFYDHNVLQGHDSKSVGWGNELFNYHKNNSVEIKSVLSPLMETRSTRSILIEQ